MNDKTIIPIICTISFTPFQVSCDKVHSVCHKLRVAGVLPKNECFRSWAHDNEGNVHAIFFVVHDVHSIMTFINDKVAPESDTMEVALRNDVPPQILCPPDLSQATPHAIQTMRKLNAHHVHAPTPYPPVLKFAGSKKLNTDDSHTKWKLLISDGTCSMCAICTEAVTEMFPMDGPTRGTLFLLQQFALHHVSNGNMVCLIISMKII